MMERIAGKRHVLIVEDDNDIRASVAEVLQESGYTTSMSANGMEALSFLRLGNLPDLILLDLMMPIMDGFAFREEQRKVPAWDAIPVVIMSADGNVVAKKEKAASADYIKKPLDIVDLIAIVEKHI